MNVPISQFVRFAELLSLGGPLESGCFLSAASVQEHQVGCLRAGDGEDLESSKQSALSLGSSCLQMAVCVNHSHN